MKTLTPKCVAVANQKGGVGKTASTVNLAYALMQRDQRVLAIDIDPQSSLSYSCGIGYDELEEIEREGKTLYHGLVKNRPLGELIIKNSLDIIPSSDQLALADQSLKSPHDVATVLQSKIKEIPDEYDFILFDCPPHLSLLTVNALSAANTVLIPVKTDLKSVYGIPRLLKTIEEVRVHANPDLEILGVLPTMFNMRNNHDNQALELLQSLVNGAAQIFEPVNRSTAFDKEIVDSKSTLERSPGTPGVQEYCKIADKLLNHG